MSYLMIFLDTDNSVLGSVLSSWIEFWRWGCVT